MEHEQQQQVSTTKVFVSNISPSASEKTVTDFFSFCGKINSLTLRTLDNDVKEAVVEFQSDAAAKTALLLTNALIVDRPITVMPYQIQHDQKTPESPRVTHENNLSGDQIDNRPHSVPDTERTQSSVVASMLAAGYKLGADAFGKAREYDEQHAITQTIKAQAEAVKAKAQQLDSQYKISETASAWTAATTAFFSDINTMYGISEKANALKQSSAALVKQVGESEPVMIASEGVKSAKGAVVEGAEILKAEASKIMEQPAVASVTSTVSATVSAGAEVIAHSVREVTDATKGLLVKDEASTSTISSDAFEPPKEDASSGVKEAPQ